MLKISQSELLYLEKGIMSISGVALTFFCYFMKCIMTQESYLPLDITTVARIPGKDAGS